MTAEAIARLRALLKTPAYVDAPLGVVDLFATDLRALLDAHDKKGRDHLNAVLELEALRQAQRETWLLHTEALDALAPLFRKNKLREGYCLDTTCPHCNELRAAETVLAKAGRR